MTQEQDHPAINPAPAQPLASPSAWGHGWLPGLVLVVATVLVYHPAWRGRFLWDDDRHIINNQMLVEPGGLKQIWSSPDSPQFYPLVFTSFRLERSLWGLNPTGYHWVNLLLHAASAVLVWRVLRWLHVPGAWLAGAVFALHPVNVESVAWISQRKNTLCMFFYLLSLLLYLKSEESKVQSPESKVGSQQSKVQSLKSKVGSEESKVQSLESKVGNRNGASGGTDYASGLSLASILPPPSSLFSQGSRGRSPSRSALFYWLSLGAFVMALLSKTAVAPLPVVLLGLAWWQRGRVTRRDVWRSAPFFAASLVLGLITVWFERHVAAGSVMIVRDDSFWSRLAVAGRAVWFYLYKALVPLNLMSIYPRWQTDPSKALSYVPGALVVGALLLLWWKRGRWGRVWLFCAAYYVAMLLPVLGFVNIGFMSCSLVADHWQYFSILAPIAVVAAGIASLKSKVQSLKPKVQSPKAEVRRPKSEGRRLKSRFQGGRGLVGTAVCGAMLVGLGGLTWRQSALYANAETLWQGTLAVNPGCQQAHYGLADAYFRKGKLAEAAAELKTTLRLKPDHIEAQKRLADLLLKMGEAAEAIPYCEAVVKAEPKDAHAHFVLGSACLASKRLESAVASYREAVQLAPDTPECLNALAWIYATCPKAELRNGAEAVRLAERACVLTKRQKTAMLDTLAAAYAEAGRFEDAVKTTEELRALGVSAHDTNTVAMARQRLALYQARKPYRDE